MSYQKFKQKRDEIESEIYKGSYRTKKILSSELSAEDFNILLYFIDEYEELTINDKEDDKWLAQFFILDK